jgi:hypothetical protein
MGIFRLEEGPPDEGVQTKENCSLDKVNVPSCFLYDAEALRTGAMMRSY